MHINSANQPALTDKTASLPKPRDARGSNTPERADSDAKQPGRDAFIPSRTADDSGIYRPPSAWQAKSPMQTDDAPEPIGDESAGIKTMPQIDEILAKIKAATPEDLLNAHQKAASENIGALLEIEE